MVKISSSNWCILFYYFNITKDNMNRKENYKVDLSKISVHNLHVDFKNEKKLGD